MSDAKNKPATKNLNPSVSSCYIESCDGSLWAQFWAQWVIWLTSSHPETPVFLGLGKFVERSIEATGVAFGVHSTKGA